MKKYDLYSKRDPAKNFSPLPNEVFYLGLSYGAIAVYGYLMHIEDRKTFQSYAGYNTIGRAVKMSANTVRKYVLELEDKHLIRTEPTTVITRDGRKRNGTLRYHIRPIREAVDYYYEQQLRRLSQWRADICIPWLYPVYHSYLSYSKVPKRQRMFSPL